MKGDSSVVLANVATASYSIQSDNEIDMLNLARHDTNVNCTSHRLDVLEQIRDRLEHADIRAPPASDEETNHLSGLCVNKGAGVSRLGEDRAGRRDCMLKSWERDLLTMKKRFNHFHLAQLAVHAFGEL